MRNFTALSGLLLVLATTQSHAQTLHDTDKSAASPNQQTAILAGGCFWSVESDFERLPGVMRAESGYIDGKVANPKYGQVNTGRTGHAEAVRIVYDASKISYAQLLDHFWRNIDPTVKDRQFCDIGNQYRTGIYYLNEDQQRQALASKTALQQSGRFKQIHTEIKPAGPFYLAEEEHQDFYKKYPGRYRSYRIGCARDATLIKLWGLK